MKYDLEQTKKDFDDAGNLEFLFFWGIGLSAENQDVKNPYLWKGENLLGFALMEVRDLLK